MNKKQWNLIYFPSNVLKAYPSYLEKYISILILFCNTSLSVWFWFFYTLQTKKLETDSKTP